MPEVFTPFQPTTPPKSSTTANATKRRQVRLLMSIAKLCDHRMDAQIELKQIDQHLKWDNPGFVTCGDEDSGYRAYDLNTLADGGAITHTAQDALTTEEGKPIYISITEDGLAAVADAERSWLSKAIEKEPITSIQVVITVILLLWSGANSIYVYYVTHK